MSLPEFVLDKLEEVPPQCRLCDNFLNYLTRELLPQYESGKIDDEMVLEDMTNATWDCRAGCLDSVLRLAARRENSSSDSRLQPRECYFGVVALRKRLITED